MNYSKISDNKFEFNRKPSVGVVVVVYVSEIFLMKYELMFTIKSFNNCYQGKECYKITE